MNKIDNIKCNYSEDKLNIYVTPEQFQFINTSATIKINFIMVNDKTIFKQTNDDNIFKILNRKVNYLDRVIKRMKKREQNN